MNEPTLTQPNETGTGRPEYTEEQYYVWLGEMRPFLEMSCTLNRAIEKAGLSKHKFVIYEKYRLKGWFSEKIDAFRALPGELANEVYTRLIFQIHGKVVREEKITREDIDILKHFAEKHRTCQPFFVTRHEVAQVEPDKISNILDSLEKTDYEELGQKVELELKNQTNPSPVLSNPGPV